MFKNEFYYNVSRVGLSATARTLPQVQVNYYIAEFVHREDRPATLLIVYYAGHGTPSNIPGHLELSRFVKYTGPRKIPANQCSTRGPTIENLDKVIWNYAEANLQYLRADVFEIFDCCHAGDLGRGRGFSTRQFEFLGATSAGATTRGGGKHSFTSGLIWALKQFAKNNERFTTSQLTKKIKECPDFPIEQVPVLYERNASSVERIVLAPLPAYGELRETGGEESDNVSKNRELLDLKFILDKCPTEGEIIELAKGVNMMIQTKDFVVHRVIWGGLNPWPSRVDVHHPIVQEAAKRFMLCLNRRDQSRNRPTSIYLQPPSPMSSYGPDLSEPATPITPLEALVPMTQPLNLNHEGTAHVAITIQVFRRSQMAFNYIWATLISREALFLIGFWLIVLLTNKS